MNPMKNLRTVCFFFLFLTCTAAFAQNTENKTPEQPYIEVTGKVEKEIVPDEIFITINLIERQEGKEKITIEQQEIDLKAALTSIGVPMNNLSLSDANANYMRVKWAKKDVIAQKQYLLKITDAPTVGKVFEKLDGLKINNARISDVSHSKIELYKKEARIEAIKAAKEKADYLLAAIGEDTGKALIAKESSEFIDDGNLNIRGSRSTSSFMFVDGIKSRGAVQELQFRKITLYASIYVKFAVK